MIYDGRGLLGADHVEIAHPCQKLGRYNPTGKTQGCLAMRIKCIQGAGLYDDERVAAHARTLPRHSRAGVWLTCGSVSFVSGWGHSSVRLAQRRMAAMAWRPPFRSTTASPSNEACLPGDPSSRSKRKTIVSPVCMAAISRSDSKGNVPSCASAMTT